PRSRPPRDDTPYRVAARRRMFLRVDVADRWHRHPPMAGGAAQDDRAQLRVVRRVHLEQLPGRVRGDLDLVGPVRQGRDVEGLAGPALLVGVAPARWEGLADPQGGGAAAFAEPEDARPPDSPGNQQVDGVGGGQAEALLLAAQDLLSAVVQEPVAGEL